MLKPVILSLLLAGHASAQTVIVVPKKGLDWSLMGSGVDPTTAMRAFEEGKAARQRRAQQHELEIGVSEDSAALGRRRTAGVMIADGRCSDAKAFALKQGDFDLAKQVASFCE